ncbi:MAG: hypothetical protein QF615_12750, partial [Planctomycetota bacterium]|nr:hypothetical protein [Planctomycetota bacterium]
MLNTVFLLLVPVLGGFTPGDARIELSGGHARLICGERIVTLLSASGPTRAAGRSQLEAGASSALRLSWPGEASLRITGAASCEWDPGTDPPGARGESTDPSRPTSTGSSATNGQALSPATPWDRESDTRVVFHDLTAVDLELRREGLRVTVPGGWSSRLERGAYHLSRRGGGPVRCEHLAGRSITWDGPRGARLMVHAGEVVSLEEQWEEKIGHAGNELASAGPGQDQGEHHAWEDASWPWKRLARGPDQASGELERREQHVAVEPIPGAPQPAPGPPTLPPTVSEEAAPESSTTLEQVPEQMPEPMPEAAPAEDLTWFPSWGGARGPGRTLVSGAPHPAAPAPPAADVTLYKSQEPEVETTLPVVLP